MLDVVVLVIYNTKSITRLALYGGKNKLELFCVKTVKTMRSLCVLKEPRKMAHVFHVFELLSQQQQSFKVV